MRDIMIKQIIPKQFGEISPLDNMCSRDIEESIQKYFGVGLQALMLICAALEKLKIKPTNILDIPCGYGRVLRFLRAAFPNSKIHACEIQQEAVEFCAKNFHAKSAYSNDNFDMTFEDNVKFDLIWVGSLVTHLPESRTAQFMKSISSLLSDSGIVIITSHGELIIKRMLSGERFGIKGSPIREQIVDDFMNKGYGFSHYAHLNMVNYGHSVISHKWFQENAEAANLALISFSPGEWAGQDVCIFKKTTYKSRVGSGAIRCFYPRTTYSKTGNKKGEV